MLSSDEFSDIQSYEAWRSSESSVLPATPIGAYKRFGCCMCVVLLFFSLSPWFTASQPWPPASFVACLLSPLVVIVSNFQQGASYPTLPSLVSIYAVLKFHHDFLTKAMTHTHHTRTHTEITQKSHETHTYAWSWSMSNENQSVNTPYETRLQRPSWRYRPQDKDLTMKQQRQKETARRAAEIAAKVDSSAPASTSESRFRKDDANGAGVVGAWGQRASKGSENAETVVNEDTAAAEPVSVSCCFSLPFLEHAAAAAAAATLRLRSSWTAAVPPPLPLRVGLFCIFLLLVSGTRSFA